MFFQDFFEGFPSQGYEEANYEPDTEYYEALNLEKNCSEADIKKAYRKMAMKCHPDKCGGDDTKFKVIQEAYSVLKDPEKRKQYDKYGKKGVSDNVGQSQGFDLSNLFSNGKSKSARRGEDIKSTFEVGLEDLHSGGEKKIRLPKKIVCRTCNGVGSKSGRDMTCSKCNGNGFFINQRQLKIGIISQSREVCNKCHGKGEIIRQNDVCSTCRGKKVVKGSKIVKIFIEPGMVDKQCLTLHGEGNEEPGLQPGDYLVQIREKKHPVFKRDGMNLFFQKKISIAEALFGGSFTIRHLDQRVLKVAFGENNTTIQPNALKCVEGEGMPQHQRPTNRGALFVQFIIDIPDKHDLTPQQVQTLCSMLPRSPYTNCQAENDENVNEADVEHVHFSDITLEQIKRMQQESGKATSEAYHEDEDNEENVSLNQRCHQQ